MRQVNDLILQRIPLALLVASCGTSIGLLRWDGWHGRSKCSGALGEVHEQKNGDKERRGREEEIPGGEKGERGRAKGFSKQKAERKAARRLSGSGTNPLSFLSLSCLLFLLSTLFLLALSLYLYYNPYLTPTAPSSRPCIVFSSNNPFSPA
jgi:hypothetical protein